MSASTITTRVQVRAGEALAREIAERRGALDQRRRAFVAERTSALREQLGGRETSNGETAAELFARCEAVERFAPVPALANARSSVERALADGRFEQARAELDRVETAAAQALDQQVQQEVVLERIVENMPEELEPVGQIERRRDGSLQAVVQTPSGGRMPLVAPRMVRAGEQVVGFGVGEARIARLTTENGTVLTGCDARERLVDDLCGHLRDVDVEIEREPDAPPPRASAQPRQRRAEA